MDEIVKQSLRKWPNVPHCFGWLGLDDRGNWFLRDDATQAKGSFLESKGDRLEHTALREFIERNYTHDPLGQWYFQNGPQRVYVELAQTPWIWRLHPAPTPLQAPATPVEKSSFRQETQEDRRGLLTIKSHTGVATEFLHALEDEVGRLYLLTTLGFGLVHTQDMWQAAMCLEDVWPAPEKIKRIDLAARFKFVTRPLAHQGEPSTPKPMAN